MVRHKKGVQDEIKGIEIRESFGQTTYRIRLQFKGKAYRATRDTLDDAIK